MKDKCKNCAHPTKSCVSYVMTLSTRETLEWCRMWKERFGWSNAALAERSKVPLGTINRVFSHARGEVDAGGVKLETIRPIICAITGCTMQELEACDDQHDASTAALIKRNKDLEEDNARLRREAETQRTFLTDQIRIKDRYVAILGILLASTLFYIMGALVVDATNPDVGFFWLDGKLVTPAVIAVIAMVIVNVVVMAVAMKKRKK